MPSTTGTCAVGAVAVAAGAVHAMRTTTIAANQVRIPLRSSDARDRASLLRRLSAGGQLRVTVRLEVLAEEREIVPALVFLPPSDDLRLHRDLHQRQTEERLELLERLILFEDEIFQPDRL